MYRAVYLFIVQVACCILSRRIVVMVKIVIGCNLLYPPRLGLFGPLGLHVGDTATNAGKPAGQRSRLVEDRWARRAPWLWYPRSLFLLLEILIASRRSAATAQDYMCSTKFVKSLSSILRK